MASATKETTMAELETFAEKLSRDLLAQMKEMHDSEAIRNDTFRAGLAKSVGEMQTTVALLGQRMEACGSSCEKRVCAIEQKAEKHEQEHAAILWKFLATLGTAVTALCAALWSMLTREK